MNIGKGTTVKPLGNRVLVKPIKETEEAKVGEIYMPDSTVILTKGYVIDVGIGEYARDTGKLIPMEIQKGNIVVFRKECAYLPVIIDGIEHRIMREGDVEACISS